jgi:hypothetical protein
VPSSIVQPHEPNIHVIVCRRSSARVLDPNYLTAYRHYAAACLNQERTSDSKVEDVCSGNQHTRMAEGKENSCSDWLGSPTRV